MSDFEQQVAEALNQAFAAGNTTLGPGGVLAVRVAAAIEAARVATDGNTADEIDKKRWAQEAALRALQGEIA